MMGVSGVALVVVLILGAGCAPVPAGTDTTTDLATTGDVVAPPYRVEGPDWYRDAVVYRIWLRSFRDSDGDGIGDLPGVIEKLDHIESLGVDALWLSPFHPSPGADSGHDLTDHREVAAAYGSLEDWDQLLDEAHARGIRVLGELILNHTSVAHPWFLAARSSAEDPKRDWYLWSDTPGPSCPPLDEDLFGADPWSLDETAGAYYLHRFYPAEPDLNLRNPEVQETMLDVARFWLDRGVDGLHLDAVSALVEIPPDCDDHPENHGLLRDLRGLVDGYDRRITAGSPRVAPAPYFGDGTDELHLGSSPALAVALHAAFLHGNPGALAQAWSEALADLSTGGQLSLSLSDPDQPRIMAALGDDPTRAAMAAVLLLTLPGTPVLYYGDEVGVTDGIDQVVDPRDRSRTPMPWSDGPGLGFTDGTPPWLAPAPGWETANVATQEEDQGSLLSLYRGLIQIRREVPVFGTGDFVPWVPPTQGGRLLVYRRGSAARFALVLIHMGEGSVPPGLDLSSLLSGTPAAAILASFDAPDLDEDGLVQAEIPAFAFAIWTLPGPEA